MAARRSYSPAASSVSEDFSERATLGQPHSVIRLRRVYRAAFLWQRVHRTDLRNSMLPLAIFFAAFFFIQWWDFTIPALGRGEYQAVFLTNGQTYFGRYYDRIGAYTKIEDVYYLQSTPAADSTQPAETRLLRRGNELHAPSSRMLIPRSAILFVEDLSDASPIAQFMKKGPP
jgi:hypothetical protein